MAPFNVMAAYVPTWEFILIAGFAVLAVVLVIVESILAKKMIQKRTELEESLKREGQKDSEGLVYKLSDDGTHYTVAGIGSCTSKRVVIAASVNHVAVTEIQTKAFNGCTNMRSVVLPASMNKIGANAFGGCKLLKYAVVRGDDQGTWATCRSNSQKTFKDAFANSKKTAKALVGSYCNYSWCRE